MTKLEELKKVIQTANPEIMELKFGCAVSGQGIDRGLVIDRTEPGTVVRVEVGNYKVEEIVKADWLHTMKILGRPIRLADVLLAYHKKFLPKEDLMLKAVVDHVLNKIHKDMWSIVANWNLLDDNLDHQSEQTINFLWGLLCK